MALDARHAARAVPAEASSIAEWLTTEAMLLPGFEALLGALCQRLLDDGMPIWRVAMGARALHPQVFGRTVIWERGCLCTSESERMHGIETTSEYLDSPIRVIHQGAGGLRRRLEGPDAVLDFPILLDLKKRGASDYVIMPLKTSRETPNFIAWTTDRPGGFSTSELETLYDLLPLIALVAELFSTRRVANDLLSVYLGRDAATRVLAGEVNRGAGQTIRAVLWHCDLSGFTALSDRIPPDALIALLDDYLEAMARPVEARGGEVLKFVGDAILAVFRLDGAAPETSACRALDAAIEATQAIDRINRARDGAGKAWLGSKTVLHVGDVLYGNVGAADRLDFTVIGAAVNVLSRVDAACTELGEAIIATEDFAALCPERLVARSCHRLRGMSEPMSLYSLESPPSLLSHMAAERSASLR